MTDVGVSLTNRQPGLRTVRRIANFTILVSLLLGCGGPKELEVTQPTQGEIQESFNEPAKTRLEKDYRITMPIAGRIARIDLEPGDKVSEGQVLAEFDLDPFEHAVAEAEAAVAELEANIRVKEDDSLEQSALIETEALVKTASETLNAADAQVQAEAARLDRATKELIRTEALAESGTVPPQKLDDVRLDAETARIDLRSQEFYRAALRAFNVAVHLGPKIVRDYLAKKDLEREVLVHQLAQAKARLEKARHDLNLAKIVAPIEGVVLERFEQGDATHPAGQDLLLLGNLDRLEVVADVLTQDALRLSIGSEVFLEPASRLEPLAGKVKRIEPAGFTKLSSLGVEQQRVNVIAALEERNDSLGVGYRLQARFITGAKLGALKVPRFSVLQDTDDSYYVFKVMDGQLHKQPIEIGLRSDLEMEILSGLSEEDRIVAHPDTTLEEGMEIDAIDEDG
jgi:HlyD family secretion protein